MVRWVVGSILHWVDPLNYFSFQPVLHDWCNKGRGMCYPVCGMVHIKEPCYFANHTCYSVSILYVIRICSSSHLEFGGPVDRGQGSSWDLNDLGSRHGALLQSSGQVSRCDRWHNDLCAIWGDGCCGLKKKKTHFIYGYMASDIWLRTILIVRKETCCRHIGYSFRFSPKEKNLINYTL